MFDVAIVGGGPAGSSCAAFCAAAGLRTAIFEREKFPREKVCGDCINPACWPILGRLEVAERMRDLPHGKLSRVDFIGITGRRISVALPADKNAEIAIKRSLFDNLLLERARELGTTVFESATVTALTSPDPRNEHWKISVGGEVVESRTLVAADGRNSTVARICGLLPRPAKERVARQSHLPLRISSDHSWRTITPLTREPISPAQPLLFFVGDAARVVEPFTGEGIYYALASGELAAKAIALQGDGGNAGDVAIAYSAAHAQLYRGRLWINRLARSAVLSPRFGSAFLRIARFQPALLRLLTGKIVGRP